MKLLVVAASVIASACIVCACTSPEDREGVVAQESTFVCNAPLGIDCYPGSLDSGDSWCYSACLILEGTSGYCSPYSQSEYTRCFFDCGSPDNGCDPQTCQPNY